MKSIFAFIIVALVANSAFSQSRTESLSEFNKIVVSPRINLILIKGDKESIRLECNNIDPKKVNVKVRGRKLRVYLDDARIVEKQRRYKDDHNRGSHGIYDGVSITAFVTYKTLRGLQIRGEGEINAVDPIVTDKLKLRAFGESEIDIASIEANKFKVSLYGESKMKIRGGKVNRQVYRIFGEAKIDSKGVLCATASVRMFGEGKLSLNATDEVHVSAFGETQVNIAGSAIITKGLVIGHSNVSRD